MEDSSKLEAHNLTFLYLTTVHAFLRPETKKREEHNADLKPVHSAYDL